MDASFAQSAIVWAALGIGLASVLYCVFSDARLIAEDDLEGSGVPPLPEAEPEANADGSG